MVKDLVNKTISFIYLKCEKITDSKYWKVKLAFILPFVVLLFAFPAYEKIHGELALAWDIILKQVANPFVDYYYPIPSHQANMSFRITVPVIAHLLHLNVTGIFILLAMMGIGVFYLSARLFEKLIIDKVSATLLTCSVAFIYAGRMSFTEVRSIFDGAAIFFLLVSLSYKNWFAIFTGVLLASFTDERALIASSVVYLFWIYPEKKERQKLFNSYSFAVVAAWVVYLAIRYWMVVQLNFRAFTGVKGIMLSGHNLDTYTLIYQTNNLPLGIWSALEGNWLLIAVSVFVLYKLKKYFYLTLYSISMLVVLTVAMSILDITRSMAYMLPALFIALRILKETEPVDFLRKLVLIATVCCFLYPAYYTESDYESYWQYPAPLKILKVYFGRE